MGRSAPDTGWRAGRDAGAALDTLGAAGEGAARLPASLGAPLLESARDTFAATLQIAALSGAVVLAAVALAAAVLLRHLPPPGS